MDLYYSQWATLSTASETSQPHTRSESVVRPMKRARQKHACSTHKAYTVRSPRPLYLCPRKPSHQVLIPGPPRQNLRVSQNRLHSLHLTACRGERNTPTTCTCYPGKKCATSVSKFLFISTNLSPLVCAASGRLNTHGYLPPTRPNVSDTLRKISAVGFTTTPFRDSTSTAENAHQELTPLLYVPG